MVFATVTIDAADRIDVRAEHRRYASDGDAYMVEFGKDDVLVRISGSRSEIADFLDDCRTFLDEAAEGLAAVPA